MQLASKGTLAAMTHSKKRGGYVYYFCLELSFIALFYLPGILLRHWISNLTGAQFKSELDAKWKSISMTMILLKATD